MTTFLSKWLVAALAGLFAILAHAYPERPIALVIGWAPGGSTDVLARLIGSKLADRLGQPVVVMNKPGASGTIGARAVASEKADGYTVYYGTNSTYGLAPSLYKSLPYDFNEAFSSVSFVGSLPMIMGVHPKVPATTAREIVDFAKKNPGKLTFGSASPGSTSHIAGELFMAQTGVQLVHIPYKGGGPAIAALLGGEIDILFNDVPTLEPLIAAKRVRGIGATSLARLSNVPDLPTIAESGLPGFEVTTTNAVFMPKGVPQPIVERFRGALVAVLGDPTMVQDLLRRGMIVQHSTPAELDAHVRREQEKWRALLQSRGISLGQ